MKRKKEIEKEGNRGKNEWKRKRAGEGGKRLRKREIERGNTVWLMRRTNYYQRA